MSMVDDAQGHGVRHLVNVACPLCDVSDSKPLFETSDWTFRVSEDRFVVRRCRGCGAGFLSPQPSPSDMPRYYPARFYWSYEGGKEPLTWSEVVARRAQ